MIVAMKFTEPSSDAVILKTMPMSQSVWPLFQNDMGLPSGRKPISAMPASGG